MPQQINVLYAFIAEDPAEGEGIAGMMVPGLGMTNLVTAKESVRDKMRGAAQAVALGTGQQVRLCRFVLQDVIEVFNPPEPPAQH